jgi:hypothetical protein
MNEHDIEGLLTRCEPAGPPPELRARIVRPAREVRLWPWAAAASILLMATAALQIMTDRVAEGVLLPSPDPLGRAADDLAEMLGGDEFSRRSAEALIARAREQSARRSTDVSVSALDEGEIR